MEEDKKVPQGLPLEVLIGITHANPTAIPNASRPTAHKDKLKNVTPKAPVQLELPFEEKLD